MTIQPYAACRIQTSGVRNGTPRLPEVEPCRVGNGDDECKRCNHNRRSLHEIRHEQEDNATQRELFNERVALGHCPADASCW